MDPQASSCWSGWRPQPGDEHQDFRKHLRWYGDLGHLESHVAAVADNLGADLDQLLAQQPELQTLPQHRFGAVLKLERRVSHDGFVAIDGNYYSVPDRTRRVVEVQQLTYSSPSAPAAARRRSSWTEPVETIDRRECDTISIEFAAAEALHWLQETQKNAPARGATHYRVIAQAGAVIGGPP